MRVIFFLTLLGCVFAEPRRQTRIVGGVATNITQYPYMSNMQYYYLSSLWFQACGGALITNSAVLSAAHCYYNDPVSSWRVRLGTTYASSGGTVYQVSRLILHPQYNDNNLNNDVAIIRLSTNVTFSANVQVANIAGPSYTIADGAAVTAIGWGTLWYLGPAPEQLQHVGINVINQQLCTQRYEQLRPFGWPAINAGMLCAGILNVGGGDACQGDSGGPLIQTVGSSDVIVGVTSWGYECAHSFYPGVNARVSQFSNWIEATANVADQIRHSWFYYLIASVLAARYL